MKNTLFIGVAIAICLVMLLFSTNLFEVLQVEWLQSEMTAFSKNIQGMAVFVKDVPYTLNFGDQTTLIRELNSLNKLKEKPIVGDNELYSLALYTYDNRTIPLKIYESEIHSIYYQIGDEWFHQKHQNSSLVILKKAITP